MLCESKALIATERPRDRHRPREAEGGRIDVLCSATSAEQHGTFGPDHFGVCHLAYSWEEVIRMSSRFFSNVLIALLAGTVVVLSMGLTSSTALGWIAFGVAIGVVVISLLVQLDRRRGMAQRLLDAVAVAVGGTLIATSIVFTATTVMWLAFALAIGLVGLAFIGLTLHEIESWRAIHGLGELHWLAAERERPAAAGPQAA